jgi:hypothetical protein
MVEIPDHEYSIQNWLHQIVDSIESLSENIMIKFNHLSSSLSEIASAVRKSGT